MKSNEVKIKLSNSGVMFHRNGNEGIVVKIYGNTKNGKGKRHEITIELDTCDMRNIVDHSKKWAKNRVNNSVEYLKSLQLDVTSL
jgi:hypothetical protein